MEMRRRARLDRLSGSNIMEPLTHTDAPVSFHVHSISSMLPPRPFDLKSISVPWPFNARLLVLFHVRPTRTSWTQSIFAPWFSGDCSMLLAPVFCISFPYPFHVGLGLSRSRTFAMFLQSPQVCSRSVTCAKRALLDCSIS